MREVKEITAANPAELEREFEDWVKGVQPIQLGNKTFFSTETAGSIRYLMLVSYQRVSGPARSA